LQRKFYVRVPLIKTVDFEPIATKPRASAGLEEAASGNSFFLKVLLSFFGEGMRINLAKPDLRSNWVARGIDMGDRTDLRVQD